MKRTLLLFTFLITLLVSCTDDGKTCWDFTVTQVTESSLNGVVIDTQTVVSYLSQCEITEAEAKAYAENLDGESITTAGTMSTKVIITVTYQEST